MRTVLAVALLAACGNSEPQTGAFDPEDTVKTTDDEVRISVHRREVPLEEMHVERWLAGLPMSGMAQVDIELTAPIVDGKQLLSKATGTIALACGKDCRLGNDKAKIDLSPEMQIDFGNIAIPAFGMRGVVENGHAKITKWDFISPDLTLQMALDIKLADDLSASTLDGCVRFAPGKGLVDRQPKTAALIQTTGANMDGDLFSIKISGTIGTIKSLAQSCSTAVK